MADSPVGQVRTTNYPSIHNAKLPAEGNGSFSNVHLAILVLGVSYVVKRCLPFVHSGGFPTYVMVVMILGVPVTIAYWTFMSNYGARKNQKCAYPGKPLEDYLDIKDPVLRRQYQGTHKIPMQIFHDAYFEGKIDFKGNIAFKVLKILWLSIRLR